MNIEKTFSTFPRFETERLILREIKPSDVKAIHAIFSVAEVAESYGLRAFKTIEENQQLIDYFTSRFKERCGLYWGILSKNEAHIIGICGYDNLIPYTDEITVIRYALSQIYWRQGIMTEALSAIIRFGFEEMGLNRIEALVALANTASINLLKKLRFLDSESVLKKLEPLKCQFSDINIMFYLELPCNHSDPFAF